MKIPLLLLTLLAMPFYVASQSSYPDEKGRPPTMDEIFSVKETFKYEVKYGFLKLGTVKVILLSDTLYGGRQMKHLFTDIRSNPKIPLVGTEVDQFHSFFYVNEDGLPVTATYWKDNVDEGIFDEIRYNFDRENMVVTYKEEDNTRDTLDLVEPATAGHVIFYFSRLFAGSDKTSTLPVYVTKMGGFINMENSSETQIRNYPAVGGRVETYLSRGSTIDIEGPFGFSGKFRAWYLKDDLRIPLEARVKVLFGNAIVRIIEYSREEL